MIGIEDAPHSYSYDGYFKILPQINSWSRDPERIKDGVLVDPSFTYSSNNNQEWMSVEDLQKWIKKYNTNDYVISEKLDGISAYYNKAENKLYTRGNGKTGSDISHILPHINLPVINTDIVRGELLISKKNWKEEYGSNARNVVAGLVNAFKARACFNTPPPLMFI